MSACPVYPRAPISATLAGCVFEELCLPRGGLGLVEVAKSRDDGVDPLAWRKRCEAGLLALVEKPRACCWIWLFLIEALIPE